MGEKKWNPIKPLMEARLRPMTFQVAVFLWYHIGKNGTTYVSLPTLAKETTLSPNSIRKALKELKAKNIICVRARVGETNIVGIDPSFMGNTPTTVCTPSPTTVCGGPPTTVCTQSNKENQVNKKPSKVMPVPFVTGTTLTIKTPIDIPSTLYGESKKMKANMLLEKYGIESQGSKKGKVTKFSSPKGKKIKPATLLAQVWRDVVPATFDIFLPALTAKQLGMLSSFHKRVEPHNSKDILLYSLSNWKEVGNSVKATSGLKGYPHLPNLDFILKHCGELAQHYITVTNSTKPIPTPTPATESPAQPIFEPVQEEGDFMTADKLKHSKFFK